LLWLLPLGLALGLFSPIGKAISQQGLPPEQLPTGIGPEAGPVPGGSRPPARPAAAPSPGLPAGVVPALPGGPARETTSSTPPPQPTTPFPVVPEAGPWMICAATYFGPDAPELARQVALELRNRHRLDAYIFNHADNERLRMRQELEQLRQRYPGVPWRRRTVRLPEQCAVLVGGYKDFDDASASLKKVKNLPLPDLKLPGDKTAYDLVNIYEPVPGQPKLQAKRAKVNPFSTAMVVRNPTVPAPPKEVPRFDPIWKQLNADEEYSLLRNRKRYTLVVKEYQGGTVVQAQASSSGSGGSFLKMIGLGHDKPGERLNASALQAHALAQLLRHPSLGFDAYVLHTRHGSIVTVGGFDELNGKEMQSTQRRLAALKFSANRTGGSDPVGLMSNPPPMEVPRP